MAMNDIEREFLKAQMPHWAKSNPYLEDRIRHLEDEAEYFERGPDVNSWLCHILRAATDGAFDTSPPKRSGPSPHFDDCVSDMRDLLVEIDEAALQDHRQINDQGVAVSHPRSESFALAMDLLYLMTPTLMAIFVIEVEEWVHDYVSNCLLDWIRTHEVSDDLANKVSERLDKIVKAFIEFLPVYRAKNAGAVGS